MRPTPTPFIGREAELAELRRALGGHRLVTLTGVGGVGKTRLALEALRASEGADRGAACVVELGALTHARLLPATVLARAGGRERPGRDVGAALAATLARWSAPLLLDGCEHIAGDVAELLRSLLERCPGLTALVTSRVPLGLDGELVQPVRPLSLPLADASSPLSAVVASDAGRLFVAAAARHAPDFGVTGGDAPAIARICAALDGVPLALELAAAHVRELPLPAIADALANGRATRLRASLDWIWRLLDVDERRLLRRMAVLAGSTGADAARVCDPAADPARVRERMERLVAWGLVSTTTDLVLRDVRFELPQTVRRYALERLAAAGEEDELRDRQMAVYGAYAARADRLLDRPTGRRALELEAGNLRLAFERSLTRDPVAALAICERLAHWWFATDRFEEGRDACARALAAAPDAPPAALALALWAGALLAVAVEDYAAASSLAGRGLELARASGSERALGLCLQLESLVLGTVDPRGAAAAGERAVAVLRRVGGPRDLGHALLTLAAAEALRDRFAAFDARRAELLAVPEARADRWLTTLLDLQAAWARLVEGDPRAAREHAERVLDEVGGEQSLRAALARAHRLHALARMGEAHAAHAEALAALATARDDGAVVAALTLEMTAAIVELALGELDGARRRALAGLGAPAAHADVAWRELLARIAAERGDGAGLVEQAAAIRALSEHTGSARQAALADQLDGLAALVHGEPDAAAERLHAALATQFAQRCRSDAADTLEALAQLALQRGDARRAARLHAASGAARRALGCVRVPPEGERSRALRAAVDAALGAERAAQARAEGEQLSLAQAVAHAQGSRGPRGRPGSGWESLTPAEARAARLAAEGLSNPQIAARLLMSRGTVKVHLSRVYAKLGVRNRTQLAAVVAAVDDR